MAPIPVGSLPHLGRGLLPGDVEHDRPPAARPSAPALSSSSVDLPTPGSPASRATVPGTRPPPSTRSSSPTPVGRARAVSTSIWPIGRATLAPGAVARGARPGGRGVLDHGAPGLALAAPADPLGRGPAALGAGEAGPGAALGAGGGRGHPRTVSRGQRQRVVAPGGRAGSRSGRPAREPSRLPSAERAFSILNMRSAQRASGCRPGRRRDRARPHPGRRDPPVRRPRASASACGPSRPTPASARRSSCTTSGPRTACAGRATSTCSRTVAEVKARGARGDGSRHPPGPDGRARAVRAPRRLPAAQRPRRWRDGAGPARGLHGRRTRVARRRRRGRHAAAQPGRGGAGPLPHPQRLRRHGGPR